MKQKQLKYAEIEALNVIHSARYTPLEDVVQAYMPKYGLYHKVGNHQTVYCTACRERFNMSVSYNPGVREFTFGKAEHKARGTCPMCERTITFLADGRGRRKLYDTENFALFKAIDSKTVVARCYRIAQKFSFPDAGKEFEFTEGNALLDYYESEVECFLFRKGERPFRFIRRHRWDGESWVNVWERAVNCREPVFSYNPFAGCDNSYIPVDDFEIDFTEFNYIFKALRDMKYHRIVDAQRISILGEYCQHPQIEYMVKTGFMKVVEARLDGYMCGLKLNWRSNDVKKVLGMTKKEMELLKNWEVVSIALYKQLKRFDQKSSFEEISEMVYIASKNIYTNRHFIFDVLIGEHHESCRSILKYLKKEQIEISDWSDYIRQCKFLKYDLNDESIFKPSRLMEKHNRCTDIIHQLEEEEKRKLEREEARKAKRRLKYLKRFQYVDEERGMMIVIPQTTKEIVEEGKNQRHCVGGYAHDHANGLTNILFLRKIDEPKKAFYTMEVNDKGKIVQCRGYRNNKAGNPKPPEVEEFEKIYQEFLDELFKKKTRKKVEAA